jgi:hypothetical protein
MLPLLLGGWKVHLSPLQATVVALSVASVLIQSATLLILSKRKLRSEFPVFFRYTACGVLLGTAGAVAYLIACECREYFYLYLVFCAIMMCFQFGVMYETFVNAMKPYSALIDLGRMLFRWAGVFLLLTALLTGVASKGLEVNGLFGAENVMERILSLMQVGLLLLFFAFERKLGLAWRSYSMVIALGLGTSSAVSLVNSFLVGRYPELRPAISLADGLVYLAVVTFWAICFRQTEPARRNVLDSPSRLIFQRWNEALTSYGYGQGSASSVESFLPGIEKTVERVMARTLH